MHEVLVNTHAQEKVWLGELPVPLWLLLTWDVKLQNKQTNHIAWMYRLVSICDVRLCQRWTLAHFGLSPRVSIIVLNLEVCNVSNLLPENVLKSYNLRAWR